MAPPIAAAELPLWREESYWKSSIDRIGELRAIATSFQPEQREKVAQFFDDGIGVDHS
jgi:hypothetical protein